MCFHIKQSKDDVTLENRFHARIERKEVVDATKNYHAFTYPKTPIISNANDGLIQYYNWGLVPFWANDESVKKYNLNAKIETLDEKQSFKTVVKKRCLIIADGFYEWKWLDAKGKERQKYLISLPDNRLFVLGGLWSKWTNKLTGEVQNTYTIVTTEANELMCEIHNSKKRMPVILTEENEKAWLDNEPFEQFKHLEIELIAHQC
ncbi:MAG: SOS response-associated peptidase [Bacteroidetes bacterium]|nr:SOS response-associated peptidase [Bacteroidota bacterium]